MVHCDFKKAFLFLMKYPIPSWPNWTPSPCDAQKLHWKHRSPFFPVSCSRESPFPSIPCPCPWLISHMAAQLQHFPGGENDLSISGEEDGHSVQGGTSWTWILLLQMHNFGPAHIICVIAGVSLQCWTWCTLNTHCFSAFCCCLSILLTDAQFVFWESRGSWVKLYFNAAFAEIKLGQLISMLFMLRVGFRLFQGLSVPSVWRFVFSQTLVFCKGNTEL